MHVFSDPVQCIHVYNFSEINFFNELICTLFYLIDCSCFFLRFSLYCEVLKFWSNQTSVWGCTCYLFLRKCTSQLSKTASFFLLMFFNYIYCRGMQRSLLWQTSWKIIRVTSRCEWRSLRGRRQNVVHQRLHIRWRGTR